MDQDYKRRRGWYIQQDQLRVGRAGEDGPEEYERNDYTPRQRRRLMKKLRRRYKGADQEFSHVVPEDIWS